jgi:tetratricopeptide (TPR) repeat protein
VSGWKTAKIAEIAKRSDTWVPIRDHLGGTAYGINAYVAAKEDDEIIGDHNEEQAGHEELYIVLEGHATFTLAGDNVDAPAGTIVFVRDPSAQRKAVAKEVGTTILAVGAKPGEPFSVSAWEVAWPWTSRGMALYNEKKYAEAAEVFQEGLAAAPTHFGLHYNLACMRSLNGDPDGAFEELAIAIDGFPGFAEFARNDSDFDAIRNDPRFPA